ncbi:hypothetical protein MTR_3g060260 [Medicago truncatula]|uniref:Uncharacterized protein n=1 Tax=Medicago truncatula TaxID=3880 RepID=G7IV15_MEDTR|nr:hypothetical protein MTR_3g060260 [Medicago truncatula]
MVDFQQLEEGNVQVDSAIQSHSFAAVISHRCPIITQDLEVIHQTLVVYKDVDEEGFTNVVSKSNRKKQKGYQTRSKESDCSGKEQSREKKDKDTSSYPGSFHNTEVVQSPLHFQGDFTIITKITTAQYFLSMRLHKKCSSTHARVFQCSSTKQETSNAQARRQETSNQTKIQRIEFELNT